MIELGFNTHSEDVQKIPIGHITVHHLYEAHPQMHDMALIRLARSAIITELSVVPICLPILEDVRSYTKDNLATFRLVPDYETDKLDEVFSCLEGFSLLRMNLSDTFRFVTYCCMWRNLTPCTDNLYCLTKCGLPLYTVQTFAGKERYFLRGMAWHNHEHFDYDQITIYASTDEYLAWMVENMDETLRTPVLPSDLNERLVFN